MPEKKGTSASSRVASAPRAILFEMEFVALKGRQLIFDMLKKLLADKGIELSPVLFSRYCMSPRVKHFVSILLSTSGKTRFSDAKLVQEINEGVRASLLDGSVKPLPAFVSFLKGPCPKGVTVGALSMLDEPAARALAEKMGLPEMGVSQVSGTDPEKEYPTPDAWLKLAKKIAVRPPLCVALVTSSAACRSAVSAGMRCVAVPDRYTGFQDFGGADLVRTSVQDTDVKEVLDILKSP
jgi:beta-phosphoglucomutase-like phosphatase (HAD superfamily)